MCFQYSVFILLAYFYSDSNKLAYVNEVKRVNKDSPIYRDFSTAHFRSLSGDSEIY